MVELKVHRFADCPKFPTVESFRAKHALSTLDIRRVTCECCKQRIIAVIVDRHWSKLSDSEATVLEVAAVESEADLEEKSA